MKQDRHQTGNWPQRSVREKSRSDLHIYIIVPVFFVTCEKVIFFQYVLYGFDRVPNLLPFHDQFKMYRIMYVEDLKDGGILRRYFPAGAVVL